ncbi:MAG: hypothetical protein ACD_45C00675G0008 [uncultured bacterium]|nr:MAG: hypothetical protein ACD_45C00675G0008 [uncultured bacterium]
MLLGEYAVLHGKHALLCAIDKRMVVTLTPRSDDQVILESALGQLTTRLSKLNSVPPFQFVLTALQTLKKYLTQGCTIKIESEFSATMGFASSAAVTVATLSALLTWLNLPYSELELIRLARKVVRQVQGLGSGADVAACVLGGIVFYRAHPLCATQLPGSPLITVIYSGHKTPTVNAVQQVTEKFASHPKLFKQLCQAIHYCALDGMQAVLQQNWQALGDVMTIQQGLMDALGVNTPIMREIIYSLRQQPAILGAKISGSGLGDCVVALGKGKIENLATSTIPVQIAQRGVYCEKN